MRARWTWRLLLACTFAGALGGAAAAGPVLLYDSTDGRVLYAEDADQPWFGASLTKMMTAYVVFDAWKRGRVARDSKVVISKMARRQPPMRLGIGVGKELTFDEAMAAVVILSANDISVAVAEAVSGSEEAFIAEMNATAYRLGMYSTRYSNPHGLPGEGQYTTAKDLATLTQALLRDFPEHLELFSRRSAKVGRRTVNTHNSVLVSFDGGDGMKTGYTCSAGYNIVATATRDGRRLVAIVLGEKSSGRRGRKANKLLGYGFQALAWKAVFPAETYASLAGAPYDRLAVRRANLDKRLTDCSAPKRRTSVIVAGIETSPAGAIAEWGAEKVKVTARRASKKSARSRKASKKARRKRAQRKKAAAKKKQFSVAAP
jgi:D-alanyl-D-alanine carboxypeptidase